MSQVSRADIELRLAQLEQENAQLKAAKVQPLSLKISDKGCLSIYGTGRFPISLYKSQADRVFNQEFVEQVRAFIAANEAKLSVKAPKV
jgi:hypothetical protein